MPMNFGAKMSDDVETVLFDAGSLQQKCVELGQQISNDYEGKTPILVSVMTGGCVFFADLLRCIDIPVEVDFIQVSSYGKGAESGELEFKKDMSIAQEGRHIIFIEDIIDTGKTLKTVGDLYRERGASSIGICALLDKKARRSEEVDLQYVGFDCPDEFVVGYGIDYAERYRNLPYVAALKRSVYE